MSIDYFVEIKLAADYNSSNIYKILEKGIQIGFAYHNQVWGKAYEDAPILNASQATSKVMKALENKSDEGPCAFTKIGETYGNLFFFKTAGGKLEFQLGGFRSPKKVIFDDTAHVDFDYYVRIALDLCKDFPIVELKTEAI